MYRLSALKWLLLLIGNLVLVVPSTVGDNGQTAIVGTNFLYSLPRSMFFDVTSAAPGDDIMMTASVVGHPDLPSWLHLAEDRFHQMGFLYGTPKNLDDATVIQIVARNRNLQVTQVRTVDIHVDPRTVTTWYTLELPVKNFDLPELFREDHLPALSTRVQDVWPRARGVVVTGVRSLADEEGRIPVPEVPGQLVGKQGVLVELSGIGDFSDLLKMALSDAAVACSKNSTPRINIDSHFKSDFIIDWCRVKLLGPFHDDKTATPPMVHPVDLNIDSVLVDPPSYSRRDFSSDFWVTIVFPCILGLVLCIMLSYIMFGRREGVEKRDDMTPDTQLSQFNTIRRATTNLRLMSNRRDGPPPLSPASGAYNQGDRYRSPTPITQPLDLHSQSRPGSRDQTLTRSQPPPPYRLPPIYPQDHSPGSRTSVQEPSPRPYADDRTGDDQRLVPRTPNARRP